MRPRGAIISDSILVALSTVVTFFLMPVMTGLFLVVFQDVLAPYAEAKWYMRAFVAAFIAAPMTVAGLISGGGTGLLLRKERVLTAVLPSALACLALFINTVRDPEVWSTINRTHIIYLPGFVLFVVSSLVGSLVAFEFRACGAWRWPPFSSAESSPSLKSGVGG